MKEKRGGEETQPQQTPWLLNNTHFCYERELSTNNKNEKKQLLKA